MSLKAYMKKVWPVAMQPLGLLYAIRRYSLGQIITDLQVMCMRTTPALKRASV